MAARKNDTDYFKQKQGDRIYHERARKREQHQSSRSWTQSPTRVHTGSNAQVNLSQRSDEKVKWPVIGNYTEIKDHEVAGRSSSIHTKSENRNDQREERLENLSNYKKQIDKRTKKLLDELVEENKKLQERVDQHDSMLKRHESLLNANTKDGKKRDEKIRIQERELKKAVRDETNRAENFHKEFQDVRDELGRNKQTIQMITTQAEQISQKSQKLSDQINEGFVDVLKNQNSSDNRIFDKFDALEARQMRYLLKIESEQRKMFEMIRIIQAMRNHRITSDNGRYFANAATEENENDNIPEEVYSVVASTLDDDIEILGQQTDEITPNNNPRLHKTIISESKQIVTRSHRSFNEQRNRRPFNAQGKRGMPPFHQKY